MICKSHLRSEMVNLKFEDVDLRCEKAGLSPARSESHLSRANLKSIRAKES